MPFLDSVVALVVALLLHPVTPPPRADEGTWMPLFDGRSLDGWKASESPSSFTVREGAITCDGPRGHLFYRGPGA